LTNQKKTCLYRNCRQSHRENTETVVKAAGTIQKQSPKVPKKTKQKPSLKMPVQYRKRHQSCRYNTQTVIKGSGTTTQKLSPKPPEQQYRKRCQSHRNNLEIVAKAAKKAISMSRLH
jgi:hypothetical protein